MHETQNEPFYKSLHGNCKLKSVFAILQHLSANIFSYWTVNFLFPGVNLTPGQKVTAVILHIDILSTCVHVSALPKLLGKKKSVSITFLNAVMPYLDFFMCRGKLVWTCRWYSALIWSQIIIISCSYWFWFIVIFTVKWRLKVHSDGAAHRQRLCCRLTGRYGTADCDPN